MASKLDMSLDAIIATEGIAASVPKKGSKGKESLNDVVFKVGSSLGAKRKAEDIVVGNTSAKASHFGANSGQIFVENLKYEVNDDDIQQLFSAFGSLKRAAVNYQKDGRSSGTAFVVFENKSDAVMAAESLQGVTLDGRDLELTVVDSSSSMARNGSNMTARVKRQAKEFNVGGSGGGARKVWSDIAKKYDDAPKETVGNSFGRGQRWNNRSQTDKEDLSQDDLDADLDSYLAQRNNKS